MPPRDCVVRSLFMYFSSGDCWVRAHMFIILPVAVRVSLPWLVIRRLFSRRRDVIMTYLRSLRRAGCCNLHVISGGWRWRISRRALRSFGTAQLFFFPVADVVSRVVDKRGARDI